jgi:spore coat protein U-like protein
LKSLRNIAVALASAIIAAATGPSASLAATASVTVTAVVPTKNQCKFNTANSTLAFGTLLGSTTTDAFATGSIQARCIGADPVASFAISNDGGGNELSPGAFRMRHDTVPTAYLPYLLSIVPSEATVPKGVWQTVSFSGRILYGDINMAIPGSYSDTVTLTLLP